MKLTCPECTTQFLINPEAIGTNGRTVRCSHCSATWFVAADADVLELREQMAEMEARKAAMISPTDDNFTDRSERTSSLEGSVFENNVLENVGPGEVDQNLGGGLEAGLAPHAMMRDRADRKKVRRRLFGVGMIWGVTFTILGMAALSAYVLRGPITEKFPVTTKMYEAFGIKAPIAGLDLNVLGHSYGESNGQQVLFVNASIKNVDKKPRDVPLVKLSFKNAAGDIIASWVVEPERSILQAGESLSFETQYPNPPADAAKFVTTFVDENESVIAGSQDEKPVITQ